MADNEDTENTRSAMHVHTAMVAWLTAEGHDLSEMAPEEVIAIAFAKRVAWRKTDTYRKVVEEHASGKAERDAAASAEKEAAKAAKAAERAEAAKAKDAAKLAKAEAAKAEAAKAAEPAKATKATKKASKGKATEEDPFA